MALTIPIAARRALGLYCRLPRGDLKSSQGRFEVLLLRFQGANIPSQGDKQGVSLTRELAWEAVPRSESQPFNISFLLLLIRFLFLLQKTSIPVVELISGPLKVSYWSAKLLSQFAVSLLETSFAFWSCSVFSLHTKHGFFSESRQQTSWAQGWRWIWLADTLEHLPGSSRKSSMWKNNGELIGRQVRV